MAFKVLFDYSLQVSIAWSETEEHLEEHQLDIGEQQYRNEGKPQDHHDQDEVDYEEEERVVTIDPTERCHIVSDTS